MSDKKNANTAQSTPQQQATAAVKGSGELDSLKSFNLNELRIILSDEIRKIRDGSATPAGVNAISNASGKILSTIKLELEYHKLIGRQPKIAGLLSSAE